MACRRLAAAGASSLSVAVALLRGLVAVAGAGRGAATGRGALDRRFLRRSDGAQDVGRNVHLDVDVRRVGVRLGRVRAAQPEGLIDHRPAGQLVPVHQRDRDTGLAGPAGAADAVHVGVLVVRALVVDHVGDVVDVDSAGRHIGGDQYVDVAGAELLECLLAGDLTQVTVHSPDGETAFG